MFSSFFGSKRRSSPGSEDDTPPIPGPKPDDGFEIIDPGARGGLYPSIGGAGAAVPYPTRPAPRVPTTLPHFGNSIDQTFHNLQGVPFQLSKQLQLATNKDALTTEIGDLLAYMTSRLNMSGYNYDFSVEKSVLREC